MRRLALLFLILVVTLPSCLSQQVPQIDHPQSCSYAQKRQYEAFEQTAGVNGFDPSGGHIGIYRARARVAGYPRDWVPYLEEKQTFCAILNRFSWFHTTWTHEQDWNNVITPDDPVDAYFKELLNDAEAQGTDTSQMADCANGQPKGSCLEVEVTPPDNFTENLFFGKGKGHWKFTHTEYDGITGLINQNLCFYGPWVNDVVHGSRPEIHPTELVWWRDREGAHPIDRWFMIGLSDDSTRFATTANYVLPDQVPQNWKPWASRPRDIAFRVVFALEPTVNRIFALQNYDTTNLNETDPVGQPETTLKVSQASVTVRKPTSLAKNFRISFSPPNQTCIDDQNTIHGYFDVALQLAGSDPDRSGTIMLQMVKEPTQFLQIKKTETPALVEPNYVPNSLHSEVLNGKRMLMGEFVIATTKPQEKLRTFSVEPGASHPCKNGRGTCVSLPLLGATGPSILSFDGAAVRSEPQMALSYLAQRLPSSYAKENAPESLKAFGMSELPSGTSILRQSEQSLRVQLAYVPLKDGHAAVEEESGPTDDLNRALHGPDDNRIALFGSGLPFSIEKQTLKVRDETDQSDVTGGSAHLYPISDSWQLDITFPESRGGHLMRADFSGTIFDRFGDQLNVEEHTWNEALRIEKGDKSDEQLLAQIAVLSGIDPEKLNVALQQAPAPGFPGTNYETARALSFRTRVRQLLAESDTLVFQEFTQLRNMADLFKPPQ